MDPNGIQVNGVVDTLVKNASNLISPEVPTTDQVFFLYIQLRTAALRLVVRSWLDVPTFATRRLHECHHTRAPSGGK
jgi:hypothetical protein